MKWGYHKMFAYVTTIYRFKNDCDKCMSHRPYLLHDWICLCRLVSFAVAFLLVLYFCCSYFFRLYHCAFIFWFVSNSSHSSPILSRDSPWQTFNTPLNEWSCDWIHIENQFLCIDLYSAFIIPETESREVSNKNLNFMFKCKLIWW